MVDPMPGGTGKDAERIAYFVIRIRRDSANPAAGLTGAIERLGSGRARQFSGAEELLCLLTGWTNPAPSPDRSGRTGSE